MSRGQDPTCAEQTRRSRSRDPTFDRSPVARIAVVALFDTAAESRSFEQEATRALEERGVDAVEAYSIVGDERMLEQNELRAKLADANVDGILIYRLIAVDERQVYRPPTPYLHMPGGIIRGDPYYWYYYPRSDYYWYWRSTWDVTRSPGYWKSHSFVIVESSLYDAEKDQLVFTAKSETMDDTQFDSLVDSIVDRVTREIVALDAVRSTGADRIAVNR